MADYKAMYYHLAGRMATALDALDATTKALVDITDVNVNRKTSQHYNRKTSQKPAKNFA